MMIRKNTYLIVLVLISLLSACGESGSVKEVRTNIEKLKNDSANHKITDITGEYQLPKPVVYNPNGYSNPNGVALTGKQGSLLNPLQAYPVKALQFTGTLIQNGILYAYIMTPDNMIYQAKVGDAIGENYGRIIKIDSSHVEVVEKYTQSGKDSIDRVVSMELKE